MEALQTRLRRRDRLAGTVLTVADLGLAELAARPFDLVWADLEHGALTVRDVHGLAVAAAAARTALAVRLPSATSESLAAVLDAGVDGVVAPRVESAADAAGLVARLRHPPAGSRGFAHRRWNGWGERMGRAPALMVQIESRRAVAAAPEIAAVPGVDALVIGPADLARDLGVAAALDGPELASALTAVRLAAASAGVCAGIAAGGGPDALTRVLGGRFEMVVYAADVRIYADAVARAAATARQALEVAA